MAIACELVDVSKHYGGRLVLSSLNLRVADGEMVAISGRSGAGKSTVLNMIGLLERPDSGAAALFGEPSPRVGSRRATRLLRTRLSYLFQNGALIDNQTVDANLEIALLYSRAGRRERSRLKNDALERVGLSVPLATKVYALSGGEQQRVALARVLLKPSDLVLADEPTGSLDAGNRDDVLRLLGHLRSGGKTIVIASHDPCVAAACDRVIFL